MPGLTADTSFGPFQEAVISAARLAPILVNTGHGLLWECVSLAEYRIRTGDPEATFLPPTMPVPPAANSTAGTLARYKTEREDFANYISELSLLQQAVVRALPPEFLAGRRSIDAMPIRAILQALREDYGAVSAQAVFQQLQSVQVQWQPELESYMAFVGRNRQVYSLAEENGVLVPALTKIAHFLDALPDSYPGITHAKLTWQEKFPMVSPERTFEAAVSHFKTWCSSTRPAFIHDVTTTSQYATMAQEQQRAKRTQEHRVQYCWTHGICNHTGAECRKPRTGHQKAATISKRMHGSTNGIDMEA